MLVRVSLGAAALVLGFLGGVEVQQLVASSGEPEVSDRAIDPAAHVAEEVLEDCGPQPSAPPYPVNENGMTYGLGDDPSPDLVAARGTDGRCGYVRSADRLAGTGAVLLYERDGVTVIGTFRSR